MLNAPPDAGSLHLPSWESWRGWWPTWGCWLTIKRQRVREIFHPDGVDHPVVVEQTGHAGVSAGALGIRYWNWQLTLHFGPYLWRWWHFVEYRPAVKDFRP
jgi:hypothetical protein